MEANWYVILTIDCDVNTFGLRHPGFSRDKVADLAVKYIIFVFLHHLHA